MKKIYRYIFAAVAIASAASCAEQIDNDKVPGGQASADLGTMTISASMDAVTKTTYKDQNVLWEGSEKITVFSKGTETAPTAFEMDWCSEDKTKASFTGVADLNAESYYAVYPHSASNACTAEGVLTVEIPAEQTAIAGGFASGANVSVAAWQNADMSSENDVIFNNVCSLLSFGFETDADAVLTKSVTVKMKNDTGYINIAGNVSVNYSPDGDLVVSEGTAESIVLNAPTGGFAKGETYYVLVAPVGSIAEMELLYTHTDGTTTCTKKNSNIIASLSRSALVPLDIIPVAYDDLPQEDFEVKIDFTQGWPFSPTCVEYDTVNTLISNDTGSDNYIFQYNGLKLPVRLSWGGYSGDTGYLYDNGALTFVSRKNSGTTKGDYDYSNCGGYIQIPSVPDRYLRKINITIGDYTGATADLFILCKGTGLNDVTTVHRDSSKKRLEFSLPYGNYGKTISDNYSFRLRKGNVPIQTMVMTYSKNISD